jgi:hypothetical protein
MFEIRELREDDEIGWTYVAAVVLEGNEFDEIVLVVLVDRPTE